MVKYNNLARSRYIVSLGICIYYSCCFQGDVFYFFAMVNGTILENTLWWWHTVDGRNPALVELGSLSHLLEEILLLLLLKVMFGPFYHGIHDNLMEYILEKYINPPKKN